MIKKSTLAIGLNLTALLFVASSTLIFSCTKKEPAQTTTTTDSKATSSAATTPAASTPETDVTDLTIEELSVGTGTAAATGNEVVVHYTGWLTNGTEFDSSVARDQPFTFTLGQGRVIAGWDQGVVGMKVGGRRKLKIPYQMAYGESGRPPVIPPKATLIFEVKLLEVKP